MEPGTPLPPWPEQGVLSEEGAVPPPASNQPSEDQVARWLLDLGGEWHLCGRSLIERHLVRSVEDLPPRVSALLGAKLPRTDPRTDEILAALAGCDVMRGLQQLDLGRTAVGPEGLRTVAQFAWLQGLDLSGTKLTLEQLAPLKGLPELSRVELAGTPMGHLDHADLFGQTAVPSALRHPVGAVQRTLARLTDLALVGLVLGVVLPRLWPQAAPLTWFAALPDWARMFLAPMPAAILLVPIEALLLATTGLTPGKALLRVTVLTPAGSKPGLARSGLRALVAAAAGWGLGLRPVSWILGALWIARLGKGSETPWERLAGTRSIARVCPGWRLCLAMSLIVAAPFLVRAYTR